MTTTAPAGAGRPSGPARSPRLDALREVAAMAPAVLPFGVLVGLTVIATDAGAMAGLLGAALIYGGSAQLTAMTVLDVGAGAVGAVVAGAIVHARLVLYSAGLAPRFKGQPFWFRVLGPQFIIDQTYVCGVDCAFHGRAFRRFWTWMGVALLLVWTAGVGLGLAGAPVLPHVPHLLLVGTAIFLALMLPRLVTRTDWVVAGTSGSVAVVCSHVVSDVAIAAGTLAGLLSSIVGDRPADP